jgi:hypothetical protein
MPPKPVESREERVAALAAARAAAREAARAANNASQNNSTTTTVQNDTPTQNRNSLTDGDDDIMYQTQATSTLSFNYRQANRLTNTSSTSSSSVNPTPSITPTSAVIPVPATTSQQQKTVSKPLKINSIFNSVGYSALRDM